MRIKNNRINRSRLAALVRRRDFLQKLLESQPADWRGGSYDRQEVASLNWAIETIEKAMAECPTPTPL